MASAYKPILTVPEGHLEPITLVSFSNDTQFLLTAGKDKVVKLWNMRGNVLRTHSEIKQNITGIDFSSDDAFYFISTEAKVIIFETATGDSLLEFDGAQAAAFLPDGQQIAVAQEGALHFFELSSKELVKALPFVEDAKVREFCFSSNAIHLAFIPQDSNYVGYWNLETGEPIGIDLEGEMVLSVLFLQNGEDLLIHTPESILLYNLENQEIRQKKKIKALQVGEKNDDLRIVLEDGSVHILKPKTLRVGRKLLELGNSWEHVVYSKGSEKLAIWNESIEEHAIPFIDIWSVSRAKHLLRLEGKAHMIVASQLSGDNSTLAVATEKMLKVWKLYTNQPVQNINVPDNLETLDITDRGDKIIGGMKSGLIQLWNSNECHPFCEAYKGNNDNINHTKIAGNGTLGIAGFKKAYQGKDDYAVIVGGNRGELRQSLSCGGRHSYANAVDISPDGRMALTGLQDGSVRVWDTQTGQQFNQALDGHTGGVHAVAFSKDKACSKILAGAGDGALRVWDTQTGQQIGKTMVHPAFEGKKIQNVAFSPNHDSYICGNHETRNFGLWDAETQELIHVLDSHTHGCDVFRTSISFSKNGDRVFTSAGDSNVIIWDTHTGKELANLYVLGEKEWAVITQTGLFDASQEGMKYLYYVVGLETIELEQLKARYYEPGLLAKLIGIKNEELPDVSGLDYVELFPNLKKAAIKADQLWIELEERNGGIGQVSVFVNDREVLEDANPERKAILDPIDLKEPIFARLYLPGLKTNKISIRVYNEEGWLKSSAHDLDYLPDFVLSRDSNNGQPRLRRRRRVRREDLGMYAIFIGTSNYKFQQLSLTFPDQDASRMHEAIKQVGSKLFKDKVETHLLNTNDAETTELPTKENIKALVSKIADKAKSTDTLLLYLSGHGITWKNKFYYLTRDIPNSQITDPAIREKFAISTDDLVEWFKKVPALRQVLIIDACDSGTVVDNFQTKGKSLNPDQIKALDRLKDRTGMFILTGSAGDKESFESSRFGQGILTYSLLLGMSGAALKEGEDFDFVDVMKLFQFSADEVPKLARQIDQEQQPQIIGKAGFDIGIVDDEVDIPLPDAKPVFVRNAFMLNELYNDPIGLSEALDDYCRGDSDEVPVLDLIFFDVPKFEDGYTVRGMYDLDSDQVKVTCRLFKNQEAVGDKIEVEGQVDQVDQLALQIMEAVKLRFGGV